MLGVEIKFMWKHRMEGPMEMISDKYKIEVYCLTFLLGISILGTVARGTLRRDSQPGAGWKGEIPVRKFLQPIPEPGQAADFLPPVSVIRS